MDGISAIINVFILGVMFLVLIMFFVLVGNVSSIHKTLRRVEKTLNETLRK